MRIIKTHKRRGNSIYEDQCYDDSGSRYVIKFCIMKTLKGFRKVFGRAYILQTIDYDDAYPKWEDTAFVERTEKDINKKWDILYNRYDTIRIVPKIQENGLMEKVDYIDYKKKMI